MQNKYSFRWPLICATFIIVGLLFAIGLYRINLDTDIVGYLPKNDPVVADGRYVIMNHPVQDRIVIDVSHKSNDIDALVEGAFLIEKKLNESGLFKSVGMTQIQKLIPDLLSHIVNNLPVMFTAAELKEKIGPLLEPRMVAETLKANLTKLLNLEGIGQGAFMARDPLGLKNFVLAKLSQLAPASGSQVYRGQLLSSDGRHLLVVATPDGSGSDTALSRKITEIINNIEIELNRKNTSKENQFTLTPVGAYRAALDNELTAKNDTERALTFATIGIALLLLLAFPRPLIGVLALVPAIVGTMMALFVYSIFHESISIMAIGFGGAIISITVDHGIAYLLFLDRSHETYGRKAAKEVWSVGLLATLTSVGAFSSLFISGFPILAQIGQFAALGIALSFIFVHTVFPMIFPTMPPARRKGSMPLQNLVKWIAGGNRYKAFAALLFAIFMLFFAKIEFHVDLSSMNTVSNETLAAEKLVKNVWGDIFSKVYLMIEGRDVSELQQKGDSLAELLDNEIKSGALSSAFIPSMIFPGEKRVQDNMAAWIEFWNKTRLAKLKKVIRNASQELGFATDAFDPFFKIVSKKNFARLDIPERYHNLLGISEKDDKGCVLFSTLTPGKTYGAQNFYSKYAATGITRVFDPVLFTQKLGALLSSTFINMALIIGASVIILLLFFFLSLKLTLIALLPISFALICSLGTLNLIGHPLDIPALMLSIVIIGMGIDYSLFFVRSYQRYMKDTHPSLELIRTAVFLAAVSTLIGFGVLSFSDHSLLRSAGLTSILGIGYSLIGAFTILPSILKHAFKPIDVKPEEFKPGSKRHLTRTLKRYRHMEAYPRLFARFKIMLDPMFPRLLDFIDSPDAIMDIGCGYGVPAAWLLELYPESRVYGIDPDPERVRVASNVIGNRGEVLLGKAPELPEINSLVNTVLMLDIIHLLSDKELKLTLQKINDVLQSNGALIIRVTIPSEKRFPWERLLENLRLKLLKTTPYFRTIDELDKIIKQSRFKVNVIDPTRKNREETWIIAEKSSIPPAQQADKKIKDAL